MQSYASHLRSLSAYVDEQKGNPVNLDVELYDTLGRLPAVENVLESGDVVFDRDPTEVVEKILDTVGQLKLVPPLIGRPDTLVTPQGRKHRLKNK